MDQYGRSKAVTASAARGVADSSGDDGPPGGRRPGGAGRVGALYRVQDRDSAVAHGQDQPVTPRVLVVDDSAGFRRLARRVLGSEGFEVVGDAADGSSGLAAVARLRPDVLLLDVSLPDISGFTVLARLRQRGDDTPVVLTSIRASADYRTVLGGCGARGFVPKGELCGARLLALLGSPA